MYAIVSGQESHQSFRRSVQLSALEEVLPNRQVHDLCHEPGFAWRNRQLPPGTLVRSMVYRGLHRDRSIASVLADLASLNETYDAPTDSAWCQARDGLAEVVLVELHARLARRMRRRWGKRHTCWGRPVFIVDGTCISMPDTPPLVEAFGYSRSKQYASRFPVARVSVVGLAGVNAVWDYRIGPNRCSEDEHFHEMWSAIPRNAICLFDRYFSSFYTLAKLRQRGIAVISRLHQRRNPQTLIARGRRLGRREWLVPLELAPQLRRRYNDPTLPECLWVRLIHVSFYHGMQRCQRWLVTTLIDPNRYPRREIVELYRRRWEVETRLGEIKTVLQADLLRSKTPHAIRRELAAILIGHSLVWELIQQAAEQHDVAPDEVSFAVAAKTILAFSHPLTHARGRQRCVVFDAMLRHIARHARPHRPGRTEPRLVKRDPVRYEYLRISRQEARLKCLT